PTHPTSLSHGNSPYGTDSVFAGNSLLINPDLLLEEGLLEKSDLSGAPDFPKKRVDYPSAASYKNRLWVSAFERFKTLRDKKKEFSDFLEDNKDWLEDYALFRVLKTHYGLPDWTHWPWEIRDRDRKAIQRQREKFDEQVRYEQFLQFLFFKQWRALRGYSRQRGIQIIGDLPIYVQHDSAEVWAHPRLFKLDQARRPYVVAGVPPDYFSATGQRWGYPVYEWGRHKDTGYRWWIRRFAHNMDLYDWVRVDHFRGFAGYWEIPATESDAVKGRWIKGPSVDFLEALHRKFALLPIIAEDLGVITPDVRDLMDRFKIPGMKILLFAFDDEDVDGHPYAPHNFTENCVVYTGTHDNNTIRGWIEREAPPVVLGRVSRYLGHEINPERGHRDIIGLAMASAARMAIFPMQDILGLGGEARMNQPATSSGNWEWRLSPADPSPDIQIWLAAETRKFGRARGEG
ncbi:MAG TPA: 4-alpha-glucanotransferase, partial [Nitrospiria bacterium]